MTDFALYAHFYDLFYANKPYAAEAAYVDGLIREYGNEGKRLLDVGCGTGMHIIEFLKLGYKVAGLDRSTTMLNIAKDRIASLPGPLSRENELIDCSFQTYRADQPFDTITALFHVMSYQSVGKQLEMAIDSAAQNLKKGGLFIFDFWHAPAVLHDPPKTGSRTVQDEQIFALRTSHPRHFPPENRVDVEFDLEITNLASGEKQVINEIHHMRYFEVQELVEALEMRGISCLAKHGWMKHADPGPLDWYACMVARKN